MPHKNCNRSNCLFSLVSWLLLGTEITEYIVESDALDSIDADKDLQRDR